jgi:hypothetical protein
MMVIIIHNMHCKENQDLTYPTKLSIDISSVYTITSMA